MHSLPDSHSHVIRANEVEATEAKVLEFPAPHTRVEPDTTQPAGASDASRMLADYRVGRNAGYEAGYAAGQQVARDEVAAALQAIREAVEQLATAAGQRTTGIAELASALAVDLAREILQRELREDGSFGADVVRQALSVANIEDSITIVMNPLEAELCAAPDQVTIIGDDRVPRTHAEVRIGSSIIDFGIDTALARVRQVLELPEIPRIVEPAQPASDEPPVDTEVTGTATTVATPATQPAKSRKAAARPTRATTRATSSKTSTRAKTTAKTATASKTGTKAAAKAAAKNARTTTAATTRKKASTVRAAS